MFRDLPDFQLSRNVRVKAFVKILDSGSEC